MPTSSPLPNNTTLSQPGEDELIMKRKLSYKKSFAQTLVCVAKHGPLTLSGVWTTLANSLSRVAVSNHLVFFVEQRLASRIDAFELLNRTPANPMEELIRKKHSAVLLAHQANPALRKRFVHTHYYFITEKGRSLALFSEQKHGWGAP